jgi:hypothetical protein
MFEIVKDNGPVFLGYGNVRDEVAVTHDLVGREAPVSLIQAEMKLAGWPALGNLYGIQQRFELGHIMAICAAHDER